MSVVEGDFESLKRYNLNELYVAAFQTQESEEADKDNGKSDKKDDESENKVQRADDAKASD